MDNLPPSTEPAPGQKLEIHCDVTVIGGGLAGKAASLQLARAGLNVICIEPAEAIRQPVGESLDWSAPDLLSALGLPMDDLISAQMATWKRHVTVKLRDGTSEQYVPSAWLAGKPFHIELRTLHVDRLRLDRELLNRTIASGVTLVRDKVVGIERNGRDGRNISSVRTAGGARLSSPWFIDASGFATCLLAREFNLPAVYSGPTKVAMWNYFPVSESPEGTTLYMDPMPSEYLEWIWEIPVSPNMISVGYIATGAAIKAKRESGSSMEDIFSQQLMKFPRFEPLLHFLPMPSTNRSSRAELAHCRRGGSHGGSHHLERSHRGTAPRGGSIQSDSEVPQPRHTAARRKGVVQRPHFANGKVF